MSETAGLAALYRDTRERLTDLVAGLDAGELASAVPACPAWTVRDVVAHLAAIPEDVLAGRLSGPPTEQQTAGQVARLGGVPVPELLARWRAAAPRFEQIIGSFTVWPAVIDVASHEQDIRGAIGRPGARDSAAIRECTPFLLTGLQAPVPMCVVTEDGEYLAGPGGPDRSGGSGDTSGSGGPAALRLSTSRFEAFRWRMGRRSRAQLAAMSWSGDPAGVLGHLVVFGPAADDIVE